MSERRTKGTGSIRLRADGRYEGRITLGGKPYSVFGKNRSDVERQLARLRVGHERGQRPEPVRLTVGDFLQRWLTEVAQQRVRPSTWRRYEQIVRVSITPALGRKRLSALSPQDVQAFLSTVRGPRGNLLTARTIHHTRAVLRDALNTAMRWGLVSRNVAQLVELPSVKRERVKPLSPSDARTFLSAIAESRWDALYSIAIAMGLRLGEILALRWEDVDLERGVLSVNHTLGWYKGSGYLLGDPKTEESRRTLPMPATVTAVLRAHRARQNEERLAAGVRWQDLDFVFTAQRGPGVPVRPSVITHDLQRTLTRLGLHRQRFHDLRHTCASLLIAQGLTLADVKETLGHSRINLTADTYSHLYSERRQEIADRMDAILKGR